MKVRSLLRDPYTYFRGSAASFYRAASAAAGPWASDSSNLVLLHGDLHIGNVGTYQGPGEAGRDVRFGVVDLDEAAQGPFQLDLLRALIALRMAWRNGGNAFDGEKAARALCEGYASMLTGADNSYEKLAAKPVVAGLLRKAEKNKEKKYVERYVSLDATPRFRSARIKGGVVKDILEPLSGAERTAVVDAVWVYLERGCEAKTRDAFRIRNREELNAAVLDAARWTRLESSGSQGLHKFLVLLEKPLHSEENLVILELKEEPTPAIRRAGLVPTRAGVQRAREVAEAYRTLLDPPPRLIGYTQMGDRAFLVRTKDRWGEELEPGDFRETGSKEAWFEAATLLGEVLGMAHRNHLFHAKEDEKIAPIVEQLPRLALELDRYSGQIADELSREFETLQSDPQARALAERAEEFIRAHQK